MELGRKISQRRTLNRRIRERINDRIKSQIMGKVYRYASINYNLNDKMDEIYDKIDKVRQPYRRMDWEERTNIEREKLKIKHKGTVKESV